MRVKRYVVESMPDALHLIRKDLGKEAVILNTKEIRSGGFLGLFGKRKIEVMAAIDTPLSQEQPKRQGYVRPAQHAQTSSVAQTAQVAQTVQTVQTSRVAPTAPVAQAAQAAPIVRTAQVPNRATSSAQPTANAMPQRNVPVQPVQPSATDLAEEVRQMKQMILRLSSSQSAQTWPNALQVWEERLRAQDFKEELIQQILNDALIDYEEELNAMNQPYNLSDMSEETAALLIRDELQKRLSKVNVKEIDSDTEIVHFVGPTGVGKTTTIAKLAAYQVLKHRRNIAFITADTYRIAAVEQLKTYANILDVPMAVVSSQQDMLQAVEKFADKDLIFMDTAGRNFRNEMYVSELNSLLNSQRKKETFLVLSLTMKYNDMRAVAHNFTRFSIQNVLFTKMDETDSYGPIFNLLDEFDLSLSYITNGQNVPEDISRMNPNQLIDKIMEESGDA